MEPTGVARWPWHFACAAFTIALLPDSTPSSKQAAGLAYRVSEIKSDWLWDLKGGLPDPRWARNVLI